MCNLNTLHQQGSGCPFCEPLVLAILSLGCGVEERQAEAMRTLGSLSQSVVVSVRAGSELTGSSRMGWQWETAAGRWVPLMVPCGLS